MHLIVLKNVKLQSPLHIYKLKDWVIGVSPDNSQKVT